MGFPQVKSITETAFASASTDQAANFPATVNSGDLFLYAHTILGSASITPEAGWSQLWDSSANPRLIVFGKISSGDEGGSAVTVTLGAASTGAAQIFRVSSWFGSLSGVEYATGASGADQFPDAPTLPTSWDAGNVDAESNLWISIASWEPDDLVATSYPFEFLSGTSTPSGAGEGVGVTLGTAWFHDNIDEQDPGNYVLSSAQTWQANTFVIRQSLAPNPVFKLLEEAIVGNADYSDLSDEVVHTTAERTDNIGIIIDTDTV